MTGWSAAEARDSSIARGRVPNIYGVMQQPPSRVPPEKSPSEMKSEIAERLKKICPDWPIKELEDLVEHVTRTTLKYPRR